MLARLIDVAERGLVPDRAIRSGIRALLRQRIQESKAYDGQQAIARFADHLRTRPIAEHTKAANEQHYEVPAEFYQAMLGPRLKYSSCYWTNGNNDLGQAEDEMLRLTCERAELENGMDILDLGCGWGSFTLWVAEHYPDCRITAVSNSASQRSHIEQRACDLGFANVRVLTADINTLSFDQRFDRVVSIEMFEHMRNYAALLENVAGWLAPEGKLFVHIFAHRQWAYLFETDGAANWMGRYFFSGGTMPSHDLLGRFDDHLRVEADWMVNGEHYARTLERWLENLDRQAAEVRRMFGQIYNPAEAARWVQRWRMFLMACSELFGFRHGEEWGVSHYRLVKA